MTQEAIHWAIVVPVGIMMWSLATYVLGRFILKPIWKTFTD